MVHIVNTITFFVGFRPLHHMVAEQRAYAMVADHSRYCPPLSLPYLARLGTIATSVAEPAVLKDRTIRTIDLAKHRMFSAL